MQQRDEAEKAAIRERSAMLAKAELEQDQIDADLRSGIVRALTLVSAGAIIPH